LKSHLSAIAQKFHDDRYCFFITGDTARRLYLQKPPAILRGWTNADILYVARHFDFDDSMDESDCSIAVRIGNESLLLECDPLARCRFKEGSFVGFHRIASQQIFSTDGLLYDPAGDKFLDPWKCRSDIRNRVLRLISPLSDGRQMDLPTIFRAIYLECEEQFVPDTGLISVMSNADIQWSREILPQVRQGLNAVLTSTSPFPGLVRLNKLNVLCRIFPELEALKGCLQDKEFHPEGDVFNHTLECFRRLKKVSLSTALGLLLHDIGKPVTLTVDKNIHFPRHSWVGANMARRALRRLGYPGNLIEEVMFYIRNHLLRRVIQRMDNGRLEAFVRHPWFDNLLRIYLADIQGSMGDLTTYRQVLKQVEPYRRKNGR